MKTVFYGSVVVPAKAAGVSINKTVMELSFEGVLLSMQTPKKEKIHHSKFENVWRTIYLSSSRMNGSASNLQQIWRHFLSLLAKSDLFLSVVQFRPSENAKNPSNITSRPSYISGKKGRLKRSGLSLLRRKPRTTCVGIEARKEMASIFRLFLLTSDIQGLLFLNAQWDVIWRRIHAKSKQCQWVSQMPGPFSVYGRVWKMSWLDKETMLGVSVFSMVSQIIRRDKNGNGIVFFRCLPYNIRYVLAWTRSRE